MLLTHIDANAVAAIIIEPVQGEGGFIPVPKTYMQRLRALCDKYGIVLIADEVQCGFGRTGTLFAMEQMGVEPDIIVTAKSIAAGMPLAAVTGRAHLMDAVHIGGLGGHTAVTRWRVLQQSKFSTSFKMATCSSGRHRLVPKFAIAVLRGSGFPAHRRCAWAGEHDCD